jgi:hypothetical protein
MIIFESVFSRPHVANVFILPAYPNPDYTSDCVHLTEDSGLKYLSFVLVHIVAAIIGVIRYSESVRQCNKALYILKYISVSNSQKCFAVL